MLNLDHPESHKLIDICLRIDRLRFSVDKLTQLTGNELEKYHATCKYQLGLIALEADITLPDEKKEQANNIIQLLYKPMTGQVAVTESDFERIGSLFSELKNSCFPCWCI